MIIAFALLLGSFMILLWHMRSRTRSPKVRYIISVKESRHLLLHEPLETRTKANEQLRQTFQIENAFTTTDRTFKDRFVNDVKERLQTNDNGWAKFTASAQAAFDHTLSYSPDLALHNNGIRLVRLVQAVTLMAVVNTLFPSNPDQTLDAESVWWMTQLINDLWIQSKASPENYLRESSNLTPNSWQVESPRSNLHVLQTKLKTELRHIIFDFLPESARTNPMNIILPAYESLWRVVLRITVEILYRNHAKSALWQQTLNGFVGAPRFANFDLQESEVGVSVRAIVNEGLRLYPPTRRIYRQSQSNSLDGNEPIKVAADIEHIHRDPAIWGRDAATFNPSRWLVQGDSGLQGRRNRSDAFMPFGHGPLACPAQHKAGPMMIAILVGF